MKIKVGCCGWVKKQEIYFRDFDVIELQQTFYKLPSLKTASNLREKAPSHFEFTMKAPQLITHPPTSPTYRKAKLNIPPEKMERYGFFRPTEEVFNTYREMLAFARVLDCRVIVFQCPPSFAPTLENKENLRKFFNCVEREGLLFVWEPRGEWRGEEIRELCEELNLCHCTDPFKGESVWGDVLYLRLHGIGGYAYRYNDEELAWLAGKVREEGRPVYVMFNNTNMYEDALRFLHLLEG